MLHRSMFLLATAGAIGFVLAASAQSNRTDERAAAAPADTAKPVTPRKSEKKSVAAAAAPSGPVKSAGPVDWEDVREELDETKASDAAAQRQVRSMELTRPLTDKEKAELREPGLREASMQSMKRVSAKEVAATRVPVLAPAVPELMNTMKVAGRENSFSAFADTPDGDYVEIIGTRMRVVGGTDETMALRKRARAAAMPELAALNAPYEISHHEQGVDLSFSRFNVAYQIAVYCKAPATDEHCVGDDYVVSLADSLAILNPEEGAPQ